MTDRALWGAVSIAVSMVVLAVGVLYAWMSPSDEPEGLVTVSERMRRKGTRTRTPVIATAIRCK
ncbi:hypothetical protein [Streptomyces sp. NPDC059743]|uniref:hypothetical protein n=1 Tax=Streptomyces sp. NPDC059743 TaxID=3346928 RepID=UPI00364C5B85